MKTNRLTLPRMNMRTFLALLGLILAVCCGIAFAMKASLTHYGTDSAALSSLPYCAVSATDWFVSPDGEDGSGPANPASLDAKGSSPIDDATVVFTATYTGKSTYVYEAFRNEVQITRIIKGSGLKPGDLVNVYDPFMISAPGTFTMSGGFLRPERTVIPTTDNYSGGMTPMRQGQEYLFFVDEKYYPDNLQAKPDLTSYCLVQHTYARIPTDIASHPDRIGVFPYEDSAPREVTDSYGTAHMTFAEACEYDFLVQTQDAADDYLANCKTILADALG